ncbi:serpin family protein [Streptomyces sp. NPDC059009]|uniref:serpin family protein n=1 Tax=Streptomyces sp. NPDC059009 TaxID=3346694 RepID=UPI0036746DDD
MTSRWATAPGFAADGGTVFSAAGVWPLLAFLADGAGGPARDELADAVGLRPEQAASGARELLAALDSVRELEAAVGLWTRRTLPLKEEWRAGLPTDAAGVLTGDPEADGAALDAWAAKRTGGQIERMPVRVSQDTEFVLASALALTTTWETPFKGDLTVPSAGPWQGRELAGLHRSERGLDGVRLVTADTGRVTEACVRGEGAVDVHLLLGEVGMRPANVLMAGVDALAGELPVVPGGQLPYGDAGPGLGVARTRSLFPEPATTTLNTVEFTVDAEHDLLARPEPFGLAAARALPSLPGISDAPLVVGSAQQSATATFSSAGFRAAAVTAVEAVYMGFPPAPEYETVRATVLVDRPFGFLAVHRETRLVLAAGWVTDPKPFPEDENAYVME